MQPSRIAWLGIACAMLAVVLVATIAMVPGEPAQAGPKVPEGEYRVLEPLHSGDLTLFPVVRIADSGLRNKWEYVTLDEGLRSGEVEVTEYGRVRGMVRPHRDHVQPLETYRGDRVNTLVLVNDSDRPLILLAGEIVTGGKQDRVIGKDRIVLPHSDPIDLSVFCIEHGRWVASSEKFGAAGSAHSGSFMVQPSVRSQAMVKENQQEVWDSVSRSVNRAAVTAQAASPSAAPVAPATTSYAKAMSDERITAAVDKVAEPLTRSSHEVLLKLREEHAVGVVAAVHGQIIWADIFATPDMLAAYWTKLVRSYAAESFDEMRIHTQGISVADAQRFLDHPIRGSESSEGETGIYRYREVRGVTQSAFYLESLLPDTGFDVHISRVVEEGTREHLSAPLIR